MSRSSSKPLNLIEEVRASSQFRKERLALLRLEKRKRKIEGGQTWDEDSENILVGSRDKMALQRQTLTQEVWRTVVGGEVEEMEEILKKGPKEVGTMRGVFGETLLHICMLFGQGGSGRHREIARMLVEKYPLLIDAQYNLQPYLGEAPLHMAIINQDLPLVRLLLQHGCHLQPQAIGSFFRPSGKVYYGEFPLSFAAITNQEEMVRLLIHAGCDVAAQDSCLGNTVLHLLVIYELPAMYDLILLLSAQRAKALPPSSSLSNTAMKKAQSNAEESFRSDTEEGVVEVDYSANFKKGMIPLDRIPNAFKRTPFALSAELGKINMFIHLVNSKKEVLWSYGNIRAVAYPLDEIDTFPDPSRYGKRGALELIATQLEGRDTFEDHYNERLKLLDLTPLNQLLQEKWGRFARPWFYAWSLTYIAYLIIFNVAVLSPRDSPHRFPLEIIVFAGAILIMFVETLDFLQLGWVYIKDRSVRLFSFLIWCFAICIILAAIFRSTIPTSPLAEPVVLSIAAVSAWAYLLFFARGFKSIGYLVVMIREMLFGDIFRFLVIYIIFLLGFSVGYTILFTGQDEDLNTLSESLFLLYQYFMADFPLQQYSLAKSEGMVYALHISYTAIVTVLMLNLLIAMMNNTFDQLQTKARLQWKAEWASIILLIERRLPGSFKARSGKKGRDLGFDNDVYYIILEERIHETPGNITRTEQAPPPKKLSVFVKDMLQVRRVAKKSDTRLQRAWEWPSFSMKNKETEEEKAKGKERERVEEEVQEEVTPSVFSPPVPE